MDIEEWDGAIDAFRTAALRHGVAPDPFYRFVYLMHFACDYSDRTRLLQLLTRRVGSELRDTLAQNDLFTYMTPLQCLMFLEGRLAVGVAASFARGHTANRVVLPDPVTLARDPRFHIGYISSDFGFSSVSQLLQRFFVVHDRQRFHVSAWALNPEDGTEWRKRIVDGVDLFHDGSSATAESIAGAISSLGVWLMVDLNGHLSAKAQQVLASRPTPIALNYLGWLAPHGSSYKQHFVTDRWVTPPEYSKSDFVEPFAYVPNCYQVNSNRFNHAPRGYGVAHKPGTLLLSEEEVAASMFVFANFNQLFKLDEGTWVAWVDILRAVPNSVLVLMKFPGAPDAPRRLSSSLERAGVSADRLRWVPFCTLKEDFLRISSMVDLFLDNWSYGAGTTGTDVLFAGAPVLTLSGRRTLSRMGASQARTLGSVSLVARTKSEYVALAVRFGTCSRCRDTVEMRLRKGLRASPLFDVDSWTHNWENLVRSLWDIEMQTGSKQSRPHFIGAAP